MADGDSTGNDSASKNSTLQSNKGEEDDKIQQMSGWLMKRSKMSHKWKRQWFHLTETDLVYGDNAEVNM